MLFDRYTAVKRFFAITKNSQTVILDQHITAFIPEKTLAAKILYIISFNPKVKHLVVFAGMFLISIIFVELSHIFLYLLAVIIFITLAVFWNVVKALRGFKSQFPYFLLSLKSLLKAGVDCVNAIMLSIEHLDKNSLLYREFLSFIQNIRKYDFDTAVQRLGNNLELSISLGELKIELLKLDRSLSLLKNAMRISCNEGASLSKFLDRVVKYCRISEQFSQRVGSATIMQQISGVGVACLAFVPLAYKFIFHREEFLSVLSDPTSAFLIKLGTLSVLFGLLILFWICRKGI
ncbi:MAG: hypothetical protein NZO16_04690 [Deltaproteobacteria bacterium]|nr:hypothetical protein [Deltaproteobacteria bacterium]